MAVELRKWRTQQSRYFADPNAVPPPEVASAVEEAAATCRYKVTCYSCFGEGHETSLCPQAGVLCRSCGGSGHHADDCPIYLMDLSIRGSLLEYMQQKANQAASEASKGLDKGRFPARGPNASFGSDGTASCSKASKKRTSGSPGIQCVVCGCIGHANCGPRPLSNWVAYCPRCAQVGHTAVGCTGTGNNSGFNRPSLLEQMMAADPWMHASQRERGGSRGVRVKQPSSAHQHTRTKSSWQKHRKASAAKAAAADPWHPSHLR